MFKRGDCTFPLPFLCFYRQLKEMLIASLDIKIVPLVAIPRKLLEDQNNMHHYAVCLKTADPIVDYYAFAKN